MGRFGLPLKKGGISLTAITEALNFFPQRNLRNQLPYSISLAATLRLLKGWPFPLLHACGTTRVFV
jgi:hypothetical protein